MLKAIRLIIYGALVTAIIIAKTDLMVIKIIGFIVVTKYMWSPAND